MEFDWHGGEPSVLASHRCCSCGDAGFIRRSVPRDHPEFGRAIPCRCLTERDAVRGFDLRRARVPMALQDVTFANWTPMDGHPRRKAEEYVATWPPAQPTLLLSGPPGRGKTHLAVAVLKAVFERYHNHGRFYLVPELVDRLRRTNDRENATETADAVHAEMTRAPIIVLDDLGTERTTDYAAEQLFRVVDARYREMKPTVVTTNMQRADLDARLVSRLGDYRRSMIIEIDGDRYPDRRLR